MANKENEKTTGLLVVDAQNGFFSKKTDHVRAEIEMLQKDYALVAASKFVNQPLSPHRIILDWHKFYPDSADCSLGYKQKEETFIFEKHQYSCLTADLLRWINVNGISEVHICGIDTDVCVLTSAVALFEISIKPVVLSWACASGGGKESHSAALIALERLIGRDNIWSFADYENYRNNHTTN